MTDVDEILRALADRDRENFRYPLHSHDIRITLEGSVVYLWLHTGRCPRRLVEALAAAMSWERARSGVFRGGTINRWNAGAKHPWRDVPPDDLKNTNCVVKIHFGGLNTVADFMAWAKAHQLARIIGEVPEGLPPGDAETIDQDLEKERELSAEIAAKHAAKRAAASPPPAPIVPAPEPAPRPKSEGQLLPKMPLPPHLQRRNQ